MSKTKNLLTLKRLLEYIAVQQQIHTCLNFIYDNRTWQKWAEPFTLHQSNICLKTKKNMENLALCRRVKNEKIIKAVNQGAPFHMPCPFGVVDYVYPVPTSKPLVVLMAHSTMKNRANALSEIGHAATIIQAFLKGSGLLELKSVKKGGRSKLAALAHTLIQEYGTSQISLQSLADELGVEKSHLARDFKKNFNMTVQQAITAVRIKSAKNMLSDNCDITETALGSGFNDTAYFCKVFKAIEGITPGEWRKKN